VPEDFDAPLPDQVLAELGEIGLMRLADPEVVEARA
jgi:hypothetical protein